MYILLKNSLSAGQAVTAAAHASLACYLKFCDRPETKEWLRSSFKKVVCSVNDDEFERAKTVPDHQVMTESSLGGAEVALVFCPRAEWPKTFKFFQLWPSKNACVKRMVHDLEETKRMKFEYPPETEL